jgi:hypothetical protein
MSLVTKANTELQAVAQIAGQRFPAPGSPSIPKQAPVMQAGRRPGPAAARRRESSPHKSLPCPPRKSPLAIRGGQKVTNDDGASSLPTMWW